MESDSCAQNIGILESKVFFSAEVLYCLFPYFFLLLSPFWLIYCEHVNSRMEGTSLDIVFDRAA